MHAQLVKLSMLCDIRAWCDEFSNRNRDCSNGFSTFSYDYRTSGSPLYWNGCFPRTDIFGITLPIVKHSYVIRDVKKIAHIVSEAFFIARNGRPGPVLIDVPKDVGLEEFTDYRPINQNNIIRSKGFRFIYRSTIKRLDQVIHLIEQASQPLFYVGGSSNRKCQ